MAEVLIVGVGSCGGMIASYAGSLTKHHVAVVDADKKSLDRKDAETKLLIGQRECDGYNACVAARGRRAAEESTVQLFSLIKKADVLVLIAGLGGGVGSGATPVIIELAQELGLALLVVAVLPFSIETPQRVNANADLIELKQSGASIALYDNDDIDDSHGIESGLDKLSNKITKRIRKFVNQQH